MPKQRPATSRSSGFLWHRIPRDRPAHGVAIAGALLVRPVTERGVSLTSRECRYASSLMWSWSYVHAWQLLGGGPASLCRMWK